MMLGIAVLFGAISIAAVGVLRMAYTARTWLTTEGIVVSADEVKGADGLPYHFQYEYVVDGQRLLSGTVAALASERVERDAVRRHPTGSKVVVYVEPGNVKRTVLIPGAPLRLWALVAVPIVISVAAFAVAVS